LEKNQI